MKSQVGILLGMVLVAAVSAMGGPIAADDGDHGGKIVFSRLVSGVVGAATLSCS